MLRALLARLSRMSFGTQLELELPAAPPKAPPVSHGPFEDARVLHARGTGPAARSAPDALLRRLQHFGMTGIDTLRLTRNRSTLVSYGRGTLRVHAGFADAPDEIHRALATFVSARGQKRAAARRVIMEFPLARAPAPLVPRPASTHPDDAPMAQRLQREHARLNTEHFGGTLRELPVKVSRRMKTRLGHYAPAHSHGGAAEIVISRRHVRRHGWAEAIGTLLHEMVHQWQEETGAPIDHGPLFRRKARAVGVTPRAKRMLH
ncbi:MAG: SprT-like domain-containing protein [Gemmatimonadaceae bacterium]